MKISRYGVLPLIVILLVCLAVSTIFVYIGLTVLVILPVLFLVFSINFFRAPLPPGQKDATIVYSPANGKIVEVLQNVREEEYIKGSVTKITIFLNVFDVHVNSSPVEGEIEHVMIVPGKKLNAMDPRSSIENEYALMGIKMDNGIKIAVKQIAGLIARRIICDVRKGDRIAQCGVVGMIRFGSRAEICIPNDCGFVPAVKVGDKVLCGVTSLGCFNKG